VEERRGPGIYVVNQKIGSFYNTMLQVAVNFIVVSSKGGQS